MAKDTMVILYVGNPENSHAFQEIVSLYGWTVLQTAKRLEALGMSVCYYPDIVVLDMTYDAQLGQEIAAHLCTLPTQPVCILYRSSHIEKHSFMLTFPHATNLAGLVQTILERGEKGLDKESVTVECKNIWQVLFISLQYLLN